MIRDGKPMTLSVTVKAMPKDFGMEESAPEEHTKKESSTSSYSANGVGLEVGDMTNGRNQRHL